MNKKLSEQLLGKIKKLVHGNIVILDRDFSIVWSNNEESYGDNEFKKYKNIIYRGINYIDGRIIYLHKDEETVIVVEEDNESNRDLMELILLLVEEEKEYKSKEDVIKGLINGEIDKKSADIIFKKMAYRSKRKVQVYVIEVTKEIPEVFEIIKMFVNKSKVFLIEKKIVLIDSNFEEELARGIKEVIFAEIVLEAKIAVGTIVQDMLDIKSSYDKAIKALIVGKRVLKDEDVFNYESMILPVIISDVKSKRLASLNKTLFKGMESIYDDRELMDTARSFLKNNLNISETSKKLFIHRNTLTYRLNKIRKFTSYDLRNFEDAVNFKIALFINSYNKN